MVGDRGRVAPAGVTAQPASPRRERLLGRHLRTTQQPQIKAAQEPQQLAGRDVPAPVCLQHVKRGMQIAVDVHGTRHICPGQAELPGGAHHEPHRIRRAHLNGGDRVTRARHASVIPSQRHRDLIINQRPENMLEPRSRRDCLGVSVSADHARIQPLPGPTVINQIGGKSRVAWNDRPNDHLNETG